MKSRCPVTQQRSPAQDGVSHRIHKAPPQKTMFNRRYVQWLAFRSILLWVVPSDKIYPKSACESEAQWNSLHECTTALIFHLSFPSRSGPMEMFSHIGQRWISSSRAPLPVGMFVDCLYPLSSFMGDSSTECWLILVPVERAFTMGVLVRTIFLSQQESNSK